MSTIKDQLQSDENIRRWLCTLTGNDRSPAMTDLTTFEILLKAKSLGASSISISPDGASSRTRDSIRGKADAFQKTIEIIQTVVRMNLNPQVNTAIMKRNFRELPDISPDQKRRDQDMGAFLSYQDRKMNRC